MAFDTKRKQYAKQHFWYCEITVDGTTYTFGQNISPNPVGFSGIPSLRSVNVSPAEVDLSGGLGLRAKASLAFDESMDYTYWGTAANPVRFWARWRAEHPYYLGADVSVYSGYLNDDGSFDSNNFQRRNYILESFSWAGGGAQVTAKDVLKLASNERSKAPVENTGNLTADITAAATSFTLQPAGIGNTEYPASGFGRLGDEVVSFTRTGDDFTIVRAQYNTVATDHSQEDVFQLCLQYDAQTPADIVYDLLTNYAGVPTAQIDKAAWDAESSSSFATTYSTLITEPTGVKDLITEFAESAPFYLYWDERVNLIQFVAIKQPPAGAQLITSDSNILDKGLTVSDKQDMRISTVIVNFGQFDPTKDLDEASNYRQIYVREDSDSVTNYGQRAIKTIYSRWINNDNKTAAILVSARVGRRFADAPRMIGFTIDAKDADFWTGDNIRVQSDIILEPTTGNQAILPYQIISVQERQNYTYKALEHTYGQALPDDEDAEDPNVRLVFISGNQDQLKDDSGTPRTLRDLYDDVYPSDFDPAYDIRFIVDIAAVCGSSSQSNPAIVTGDFTGLTTPPLLDVRGLVVGYGGKGQDVNGAPAEAGGLAINMQNDLRINNTGIIGGGGGGGGQASDFGTFTCRAAGGGGAGYTNGVAGLGTNTTDPGGVEIQAEDGTNTSGGAGGFASGGGAEPTTASGGAGGDLGQAGVAGGLAGAAIDQNGFTITYVETGDIRGAIIP